jgi:hypothetical protein
VALKHGIDVERIRRSDNPGGGWGGGGGGLLVVEASESGAMES